MNTRPLIAALAVLALFGAAAPLAGTQAAEIGEGVEIQPANGPNGAYAQVGPSGQVSIQLDGDAGVPGEGLQADAVTRFDRVLLVLNTNVASEDGNRQAYVYIVDQGPPADDFTFYRGADPDAPVEGETNAIQLGTGESTSIGFTADTRGDFEVSDLALSVIAEVSEVANGTLAVETDIPTAGEPVIVNATGSSGDGLRYVYNFDDGTVASGAGPTTQHVFNETGTYDVTLSVEETASRAPNESDAVSKEVIVRGGPQVGDTGETIEIPDPVPGGPEPALQSVSVTPDASTGSDVLVRAVAAESVSDITGTSTDGSATVAAGNITLVSAPAANATVTLTVAESALPAGVSPDDLAVERYNGTGWDVLPTAVEETSGSTVTLAAGTPGFSPLAVTVNDAPALDDGDESDSGPGGGGGGGGGGGNGDAGDDADSTDGEDGGGGVPTETEDVSDVGETVTETETVGSTDAGTETEGADISTETETAEPGGAAVTPSTDQPTDREPSGFSPTPALGAVLLVALLVAVIVLRIRRQE